MDRSTATIDCPDCAHPIPRADFVNWGTQTMFKSTSCTECSTTVTYPSTPDGALDTTGAPIGRGVHGTDRESRATEFLVSRPSLERRE
jgi:hypothetical protein